MSEIPEDVAFLCRSDHRIRVLTALTDRPRDRRDLRSLTGASQPTVSRILTDFEDRHWITRMGHRYRLTALGALVAEDLSALIEAMTREERLRDIWPWLPHDIADFSIDMFSDVVVSKPGPTYPHQPVERFAGLLADTSTMRGFGMAVLKSGDLTAFFERLVAGFECEYIYPPAVFESLLSWDREMVNEALSRGNYTVYLHDDLPMDERCGICLLDDRTTICCYDAPSGTLQSFVDTGSAEFHDWADGYYRQFRDEAHTIEEHDGLLAG